MGIKKLLQCFRSIATVIGSILVFFLATKMFSFVLAKENIVNTISTAIYSISTAPIVIMLIINVFFLLMGCLSDPLVNIMLFGSLAWSVAQPLGIDANAFGMIVIFNCMIGLITPPVGGNVFLIAGLTKVPLQKVFRQSIPFVVGFLVVLVLMSIFPEIVSFFPNLIMG
jgi:TRAP-type C4-dicarboxylate transport system permease large subunit